MKSVTGLKLSLISSVSTHLPTQKYWLARLAQRLRHVYIDAFAGPGVHLSKTTGEEVEGSPTIAANTQPPFTEYHFIDLDGVKVENLRAIFAGRRDVPHLSRQL